MLLLRSLLLAVPLHLPLVTSASLHALCWLRQPLHAGDAEPDQAEAALLEGLQPAVQVRHKSRAVAVAPSLPTWLLALPAGPASRVLPTPEDLGGRPDEMLPPIGDAIAHELQQAAASQPGAALLGTPQSSLGLPAGPPAQELQQAAAGQPGVHLAAADPAGLAAGPKRAEWVFMDPAQGRVLSQAECARQYPTLSQVGCPSLAASAAGGGLQVLSQAECAPEYPTLSHMGCPTCLPASAANGGLQHPARPLLHPVGVAQGQLTQGQPAG